MATYPFELILNPSAGSGAPYGPEQAEVLNAEGLARARSVIAAWPEYSPTPLVDLGGIARSMGVAHLYYKDEGQRFGLKSFKPLGGAYAVARLLLDELPARTGAAEVTVADLLAEIGRAHV